VVEVQGDGVLQIGDEGLPVIRHQIHGTELMTIAKDQVRDCGICKTKAPRIATAASLKSHPSDNQPHKKATETTKPAGW